MNVRKQFRKLGVIVAMSSTLALTAPAILPSMNGTAVVSAATVKINNKKLSMITGESKTLKIAGSKEKVKWSSSDKNVAKVSSKGKVTAVSTGTATITAKVGKKSLKCEVTVAAFEAETFTSKSGVNFLIPEGWTTIDYPIAGADMTIVKENDKITSSLVYAILATDPIEINQFADTVKKVISKESQEASVKGSTGIDMPVTVFDQTSSVVDGVAVVRSYMEFTYQDQPAIQAIIYDVYDGQNWVEVVANNCYDSDINYVDYATYVAENLSYAK